MRHENTVTSTAFSASGTRVVTASADKTARMWDAATGTPLGEPMRHSAIVHCAAFSHDGTRIVTASADYTARMWDAATGTPLGEAMRHLGGEVRSAAFSPDGTRVVHGKRGQDSADLGCCRYRTRWPRLSRSTRPTHR